MQQGLFHSECYHLQMPKIWLMQNTIYPKFDRRTTACPHAYLYVGNNTKMTIANESSSLWVISSLTFALSCVLVFSFSFPRIIDHILSFIHISTFFPTPNILGFARVFSHLDWRLQPISANHVNMRSDFMSLFYLELSSIQPWFRRVAKIYDRWVYTKVTSVISTLTFDYCL